MAKLSQKQIDAINAIDSDVEIIACAGAGKTGVVTRRIINILKCNHQILLCLVPIIVAQKE